MQTFSFFIGIDISKLTLHLSYSQAKGKAIYEQIDNTEQAISAFFDKWNCNSLLEEFLGSHSFFF